MGVRGAAQVLKSGQGIVTLNELAPFESSLNQTINLIVVDMNACFYSKIKQFADRTESNWDQFWKDVLACFPSNFKGTILFVFDGNPNAEKKDEHCRREQCRFNANEILTKTIDDWNIKLNNQSKRKLSRSK